MTAARLSLPAEDATSPAVAVSAAPRRRPLRAWLRIASIGAWTGAAYLTLLGGQAITAGSGRNRLRWRHWLVRHWSRGVARLLGMKVRVTGAPPRPPFFLVSNHLSYVDIILLYTCLDCVFIAKHEMRRWPGLGLLAHAAGTIWVNRESPRDAVRVLSEIDAAMARGDGVVLFPEGTTSPGSGLLPMRPALFDWAARRQHPVHCTAIGYRSVPGDEPAHLSICWWGDMEFAPHLLDLCRLRGFEADVRFAPAPVTAPDRGSLALRARDEILRHFEPVVTPERLTS